MFAWRANPRFIKSPSHSYATEWSWFEWCSINVGLLVMSHKPGFQYSRTETFSSSAFDAGRTIPDCTLWHHAGDCARSALQRPGVLVTGRRFSVEMSIAARLLRTGTTEEACATNRVVSVIARLTQRLSPHCNLSVRFLLTYFDMRNIILLVVFWGVLAECQVCDPIITDSLGNQIWQAVQKACEVRHPTEAARLSKLRNSILDLANAKRNLIQTVQGVVSAQSIPGWLETRVKEIPALQWKIKDLVLAVARESDVGGLLAGDPSVKSLRNLLIKKGNVLCDLDQISTQRFPLPGPMQARLSDVLAQLQAEASALDDLDASLTRLIASSNDSQKPKQSGPPKK